MGTVYKGVRGDLDVKKYLIEEDERLIWSDLWNHFNTVPGERPKMLDFGSSFRFYLFEPNDKILSKLVRTEVRRIVALDPRIDLLNLNIQIEENSLTADISVFLKNIGTKSLLNFNFVRKV